MITRAQAEALLTLAESLEACERAGLQFIGGYDGEEIISYGPGSSCQFEIQEGLKPMAIRLAVNALIPKSET